MSEFENFRRLKDAGLPPEWAYHVAKEAGFGCVEFIKMLRAVYSLSLEDAKAVWVKGATGLTLSEYQGTLLPELKMAFENGDNGPDAVEGGSEGQPKKGL